MKRHIQGSQSSPQFRTEAPVRTEAPARTEGQAPQPEAALTQRLQENMGNTWLLDALSGRSEDPLAVAACLDLQSSMAGVEGGLGWTNPTSNLEMQAVMRQSRGEHGYAGALERLSTAAARALPAEVVARMGTVLDHNFAGVRIHTDAAAAQSARDLDAHAFTVGREIWFGQGEFNPGTVEGDRLLAHELTHVKQHDEGRLPARGDGRQVSSPGDSTEKEAVAVADQAVRALGSLPEGGGGLGLDPTVVDLPGVEAAGGETVGDRGSGEAPVEGPVSRNEEDAACEPMNPEPGSRVEAQVGGRWRRVTVVAVEGDSVQVRWAGEETAEVNRTDLRPLRPDSVGPSVSEAPEEEQEDAEDPTCEDSDAPEEELVAEEHEESPLSSEEPAGEVGPDQPMIPGSSPLSGGDAGEAVATLCDPELTYSGDLPALSTPELPDLDDSTEVMICEATGMDLEDHAELISGGLEDLHESLSCSADLALATAGETVDSTESSTEDLTCSIDQSTEVGLCSLDDALEGGSDLLSCSLEDITAATSTDLGSSEAALDQAEAEGEAAVQAFLLAQAQRLEQLQVGWQGNMATTLSAYAEQVLAFGEEKYAEIEGLEAAAEQAAQQAAAFSNSPSDTNAGSEEGLEAARTAAGESAKKEAYTRYKAAVRVYAQQAADSLLALQEGTDLAAVELTCPTLEELDPAAVQAEQRRTARAERARAEADRMARLRAEQATLSCGAETETLESAHEEVSSSLESAEEGLCTETETASELLSTEIEEGGDAIATHREEVLASLEDVVCDTEVLPVGEEIATAAETAAEELECSAEEDSAALQDRGEEGLACIEEHAEERQAEIDSAAEENSGELLCMAEDAATALSEGDAELSSSMMEGTDAEVCAIEEDTSVVTESMTSAGDEVSQSGGAQVDSFMTQLNDFMASLQGEVNLLLEHAMQAAEAGNSSARSGVDSDLRRRARELNSAMSGPGTSEAGLITNLSGLTGGGANGLMYYFHQQTGDTLVNWLKDDLDWEDGEADLWRACAAYLRGNQAAAAREVLIWAGDITFSYEEDRNAVQAAMESLDEDQRFELVHSEGFEEIRSAATTNLFVLSPVGGGAGDLEDGRHMLEAITDPELDHHAAGLTSRAWAMHRAGTGVFNPTDEAAIFSILESSATQEDMEEFRAIFEAQTGGTLEDYLASELNNGPFNDSREYDRAMAGLNGDVAGARAIGVNRGLDENEQDAVLALLNDPNLSTTDDWLARHSARSDRALLNDRYSERYDRSISEDIDTHLTLEEGDVDREGYANRLAHSYLNGEQVDPADMLGYGAEGAGTREDRVQEALRLFRDRAASMTPEQRRAEIERMESRLRADGLLGPNESLEQYLGTGDYIDDAFTELEGEERHEADMTLREALSDANSVTDQWGLVQRDYEWYRGELAADDTDQFELTDITSDSGERMDELYVQIRTMVEDESWYDTATGRPNADETDRWRRFSTRCQSLRDMCRVFRTDRDRLADAVTTAITTLAAIASVIVTGGLAAPLWVGAAISAAGAAASIVVRIAIQGNGYSLEQGIRDVASMLVDVAVALATAGVGTQRVKVLLEGLKEAGGGRALLATALTQVPGELRDQLMNEATWDDPNWDEKLVTGLSWSAFRILATSGVELRLNPAMDARRITGATRALISTTLLETTRALTNPQTMSQAPEQVLFTLLRQVGTAVVGAAGTDVVRAELVRRINSSGRVSAATIQRLGSADSDARTALVNALDPAVQNTIPLASLRAWGITPRPDHPELQTTAPEDATATSDHVSPTVPGTSEEGSPDSSSPTTGSSAGAGVGTLIEGNSSPAVSTLNSLDDTALRSRLMEVHNIGPARAALILTERRRGGPFRSIQDMVDRVDGIGPSLGRAIERDLGGGL